MIAMAGVRIFGRMVLVLAEFEVSNYWFEGLGLGVSGAGSAVSGVSITP